MAEKFDKFTDRARKVLTLWREMLAWAGAREPAPRPAGVAPALRLLVAPDGAVRLAGWRTRREPLADGVRIHPDCAPDWPSPPDGGDGAHRVIIEGRPRIEVNVEATDEGGNRAAGGGKFNVQGIDGKPLNDAPLARSEASLLAAAPPKAKAPPTSESEAMSDDAQSEPDGSSKKPKGKRG